MKKLVDCKKTIHTCSKCGLCQSVCPIYKITGNDCTVSRGQFLMLQGLLDGKYKMSKTLNNYLSLCLKCSACSKFCPSGIDVVDIIALAKAEYFNKNIKEKLISIFERCIIYGLLAKFLRVFGKNKKSKKFDKKVIYFGGCGNNFRGNSSVIKILNSCGIEVISPNFDCCGIPFFVRGDMKNFEYFAKSFLSIIDEYDTKEIVTTCASCEKTLKSYSKWFGENGIVVKNIYEYIRENQLQPELKKKYQVTFHKPCNLDNYEDIKYLLNNTQNLEYIEAENYNECCGFGGISNISGYKTLINLFKKKHQNLAKTKCNTVLTSCPGCEIALKLFSFGKYRVKDFTDFLGKNTK